MTSLEYRNLYRTLKKELKAVMNLSEYKNVCNKYNNLMFNGHMNGLFYVAFLPAHDMRDYYMYGDLYVPEKVEEFNGLVNDNMYNLSLLEFNHIFEVLNIRGINVKRAYLSADPDLREKYDVCTRYAPTIILFKNGKEVARFEDKNVTVSQLLQTYNENV